MSGETIVARLGSGKCRFSLAYGKIAVGTEQGESRGCLAVAGIKWGGPTSWAISV